MTTTVVSSLQEFLNMATHGHFKNLVDSHLAIRASECGAFGDLIIYPGELVVGKKPLSDHCWVRVGDLFVSGSRNHVAGKLYDYALSRGLITLSEPPAINSQRSTSPYRNCRKHN